MSEQISRRRVLGLSSAAAAAGVFAAPSLLPGIRTENTADDAEPPEYEDAIVVSAVSAISSLDPALSVDTETERVCRQIFEGLIGIDRETGATAPLLATEWNVSSDELTYTFELQEGITFHDGTEFTAEAVVQNFERWGRLPELYGEGNIREQSSQTAFESVFGGFLGEENCVLESVEAADEYTVVLELSEPVVFLTQALTLPAFGIASPSVFDDDDPGLLSRNPVGTGAYRVVSAETTEVTLEVYEDYWGEQPSAEHVIVKTIPRSFDRLRDLQRGEIDVYDYITTDNLRPLAQSGRLILQRDPFSVLYLGFNLSHPVISDPLIRQAIAVAIDRGALVRNFFLEGTRTAHEFVPPSLAVSSENTEQYIPSLTEAQEMIEDSDYDGEPLPFYYPMNATRSYLPRPEAVFAQIAADLTRAGLNIRPQPVPWDEGYVDSLLADEDRAMHLLGRNGGYRDPHSFLGPLFSRTTVEFGYEAEAVLDLIREARAETDDEARTQMYQQVAETLAEDLPALPLAFPISGCALGRRVLDYPTSPVLHELFRDIAPAS